jgi:hypothetical protein
MQGHLTVTEGREYPLVLYIKSLDASVRLSDVTFRDRIGLCLGESFEVSRFTFSL